MKPIDYVVDRLKSGALQFSCDDPDNPVNFPRNMFVWRSNILGSSGKGHEYFLKYLLGTQNALLAPRRRHHAAAGSCARGGGRQARLADRSSISA